MSLKSLSPRRFGILFAALAFIVLACSVVGNDKPDQNFSFTKSYDNLAQFDSVHITLRDTAGRTIDILYHGKVDTIHEIENLAASHWNGDGIAVLSIVGFKDEEAVYRVDKRFNGANDQILDSLILILPGTLLAADALSLTLTEGDSVSLPKITVTPVELSEKSVAFTSSAPNLLQVGATFLRALQRGAAKLTATLISNPAKTLILNVTILPNPLTPDSLFLSPDTLHLAAGGSAGTLSVKVSPASADPGVSWSLKDSSIARFAGPGTVQGLKQGSTLAFAASRRRPSLIDTAFVQVSAPVAVAQVRFRMDSLDLFIGGAAESLSVEVLPALANPNVEFTAANPALISLSGNRIQGLAEGTTDVTTRSAENPALTDTLIVKIFPAQHVDSVRIAPDSLRLYTGAPGAILTGKAFPAGVYQSLLWRSQSPAVATVDAAGKVTPIGPGKTLVIALSRADSSRQDTALVIVKRDMPQVSVGGDTIITLGATLSFHPKVEQEYGTVTQFRWDLNGDGVFEGNSDSVKTVSYTYAEAKDVVAAFSIKDSEGNDTTVYKKIRTVAGVAVQIIAPKDSSYTNLFTIDVRWSVNGKEQDSLKKQSLKPGPNLVTRSVKDEAGIVSASITVFVDTIPPLKPTVRGPAFSASKTPTWTWASGGGGGSGTYKYWLDVDDSAKAKEIKDTVFTPATELTESIHTLFVSERDLAGNWSPAGRFSIKIDATLPGTPLVAVTPASPTNVRRPKWSWATGGNGGIGAYQYKLDNGNLSAGATATSDTTYTPATNLTNGSHTLYVQEKDSTGNWSGSGSATILVDTIAPSAPVVSNGVTSPTNNTQPTWNWTSGGGGKGLYRYKLDDTVWVSGASQGTEKTFTPGSSLAEGSRVLYVEEQDTAGNWSAAGSKTIRIDLTPPAAPNVTSSSARTTNLKPTWTWTTVGGGGAGFRYKMDNPDLSTSATLISVGSFTPQFNIAEGPHTLYVQESDSTGNWSTSGSFSLVIYGQTGYAIGGNGTIVRTKNGGATWTTMTGGNDAIMKGIHFFDPSFGVVVGNRGTVMRSSDSGKTWARSTSGIDTTEDLRSVHFPTRNIGYAVSSSGKLFKTTNGGTTWSGSIIDAVNGSSFYSVFFTDASTGYAAGSYGEGGKSLFKTTNGGSSWTRSGGEFEGVGYDAAITFTSPTTGYLATDFSQILRTTNAGGKWDTLDVAPPTTFYNLRAIDFPTIEAGYAVGAQGIMFTTPDHGDHWIQISAQTSEDLLGVFFSDEKTGYVTGSNGTLKKTMDGGSTWSPLNSTFAGTTLDVNGVFFP